MATHVSRQRSIGALAVGRLAVRNRRRLSGGRVRNGRQVSSKSAVLPVPQLMQHLRATLVSTRMPDEALQTTTPPDVRISSVCGRHKRPNDHSPLRAIHKQSRRVSSRVRCNPNNRRSAAEGPEGATVDQSGPNRIKGRVVMDQLSTSWQCRPSTHHHSTTFSQVHTLQQSDTLGAGHRQIARNGRRR